MYGNDIIICFRLIGSYVKLLKKIQTNRALTNQKINVNEYQIYFPKNIQNDKKK